MIGKNIVDPRDAADRYCNERLHEQIDWQNPENLVPGSGYKHGQHTGVYQEDEIQVPEDQ